METVEVRPASSADAAYIRSTLQDQWGTTIVVRRGEPTDATLLPAIVAWRGGTRVGLATFRTLADLREIVTLDAIPPGMGTGAAMIRALRAQAYEDGIRRLWLITTNDNTRALRFYQRCGFDLVALHRNALDVARQMKPQIPLEVDGIPLRHELELALEP
ncbi:MAG TPA: GNAT family N-acetyltransferase [Amycolatopsis sp.]|nr:GNAT family N-acetyltransferase [Amycolatopsis sp.]